MSGTATDRATGIVSDLAIKAPCGAYSTGNIALTDLQTLAGVLQTTGMRTLVCQQTNSKENGIYNADNVAWQRASDFQKTGDVMQGTLIPVYGSTLAKIWQVTSSNPVIIAGTTATSSIVISTYI